MLKCMVKLLSRWRKKRGALRLPNHAGYSGQPASGSLCGYSAGASSGTSSMRSKDTTLMVSPQALAVSATS